MTRSLRAFAISLPLRGQTEAIPSTRATAYVLDAAERELEDLMTRVPEKTP